MVKFDRITGSPKIGKLKLFPKLLVWWFNPSNVELLFCLSVLLLCNLKSSSRVIFPRRTSVISFPRVRFLSLYLIFFWLCSLIFSLVVRYSSANSLTILQNWLGLVSFDCDMGRPIQIKNLWYLQGKKRRRSPWEGAHQITVTRTDLERGYGRSWEQ